MEIQHKEYEFATIIACLREIFGYMRELRGRIPIASEIQNPRIPSTFSENLVKYFLQTGEISLDRELISIRLDRKKADLIAVDNADQEIKIEVKATGRNNFQYFSGKDIEADYLVWLDFGTLFENLDASTVDVYVIQPKLDELKAQKIDLRRLEKVIRKQPLNKKTVDLRILEFC